METPRIAQVRVASHLRLLVTFEDGTVKAYDCAPLLVRQEFRLLADPGFFKAVRLDIGGYGISWNEEIDLSEYELWHHGIQSAAGTATSVRDHDAA